MDYILGVESAADNTNVNVATLQGAVMFRFTVGTISLIFANEEEVRQNLAEVFLTAQMAGYPVRNCRQVCLGVAGLQPTRAVPQLETTLRGVMYHCGYRGDAYLVSDEQIALMGAVGREEGMILVAEDAAVCFGKNRFHMHHRTGGFAQWADDDGSRYAIGRRILRAAVRGCDGRSAPTRLTAQLYLKFSLGGKEDLLNFLRRDTLRAQDICALADLLPEACRAKDRAALQIVEESTDELLELVKPVASRLQLEKNVLAVAGKLLLEDVMMGMSFKKKITQAYPDMQCVPPKQDRVMGAVLLAKERLALRGYRTV